MPSKRKTGSRDPTAASIVEAAGMPVSEQPPVQTATAPESTEPAAAAPEPSAVAVTTAPDEPPSAPVRPRKRGRPRKSEAASPSPTEPAVPENASPGRFRHILHGR